MYNEYQGYSVNPAPKNPEMPPQRDMVLAQAYVPDQKYVKAFPPMEALVQGTLFPELVRPYTKRK